MLPIISKLLHSAFSFKNHLLSSVLSPPFLSPPAPSFVSSLCPQPLNIIHNTWPHVKIFIKSSPENQIINWNRMLQQRMFTCISIRSISPVTSSAGSWTITFVTKILVKSCIDKLSQYFIFCPSTYSKSLVPFLWPLVNGLTTYWNVTE